jgi:hypothetical protein
MSITNTQTSAKAATRDGTQLAYNLNAQGGNRPRVALMHSLAMNRAFWQSGTAGASLQGKGTRTPVRGKLEGRIRTCPFPGDALISFEFIEPASGKEALSAGPGRPCVASGRGRKKNVAVCAAVASPPGSTVNTSGRCTGG